MQWLLEGAEEAEAHLLLVLGQPVPEEVRCLPGLGQLVQAEVHWMPALGQAEEAEVHWMLVAEQGMGKPASLLETNC